MNKRTWVVGGLVVALALAGVVIAGMAASSHSAAKAGFSQAKGESAWYKAGISNEGPSSTYEAQQEALRAYPADSIPAVATANSIATFNAFKKTAEGDWESIGANQAKYPALLDQFLAGGKPYTASGRVTAMGVGGCKKENECRLYVGAAGGGIWATDHAFKGGDAHWEFLSDSFATNAIGTLRVDPSDPTGNTVYAGTGEPNASGDSEAGMGLYKSTDGGATWAQLPAVVGPIATSSPGSAGAFPNNGVYTGNAFLGRSISSIAIDPTNPSHLYVASARGVRGVSSVSGGSTSNPSVPRPPYGLFESTDGGATFSFVWDGSPAPPMNGTSAFSSIRGVNQVALDPDWNGTTNQIVYAADFPGQGAVGGGVWRSTDGGATWTQIKTALNAGFNTDRAEFAVNTLPGGFTRMYVGVGNQQAPAARFYRTDDAAGAAVFADMTTAQNIDWCTGQCWYDNVVVSPAGAPGVVYLGGSFDYNTVNGSTNGRAFLLSTDGGATWSDLTRDHDDNGWIHPDQHALVTNPTDPLQFIVGDDGGVVRSNGKFKDVSSDCDDRGLSPGATTYCKSLLWRVPDQMAVLNKGLVTLQFQSLSVDPKDPLHSLMGGTQDNGTFEYKGSDDVWPQIIYGDGGQSGWNAADSHLRFNTFFGQAHDANFRNGQADKWVIISGDIVSSPEGSNFYPPIIADPNPAMAGSIFEGSQSVWRTQDWGGDRDFLEANCPEFTTSAANPACGDFVRIGPVGATDLTAAGYGDRAGAFVAAIERAPSNTGTMWAATNTGRVFITDNANAADPATVAWTRLDSSATNDPGRFVSSIYVDPANPNHAWISYSGYNFNTPAQPGHVFEVTRVGGVATWVDRTLNLADLPITDLVRDDLTGDLYAASDFGVMKLANGAGAWTIAAAGMPMVEVPGLTIVPGARVLYAATHGLGAWRLDLGEVGP